MTTYTATLDTDKLPTVGNWIISTNTSVDGHICEGMTLTELLEAYGFDNVTNQPDGIVTFTD